MDTALVVIWQVLIILILIGVGIASRKTGLISEKGADDMSSFALKVVTPCVVINAFQTEFNPKMLTNFLIAAALAVLTHIVAIAAAKLCFFKSEGGNSIRRFASIYSNCGFMGIPLIEGAIGPEGVLYASAYLVVFQAILWSHGVATVKGSFKSIKPYKIFINAGTIGIMIGLPLYFMSIKLPFVLGESVRHIANLNTPLAMIVTGVYMANSNILDAFKNLKNYLALALRHFVVPAVMMVFLLIFKFDNDVSLAILILSGCPVAAACTLFASQFGSRDDLECSSQILTLSNVLSVISIPVIIIAYGFLQNLFA